MVISMSAIETQNMTMKIVCSDSFDDWPFQSRTFIPNSEVKKESGNCNLSSAWFTSFCGDTTYENDGEDSKYHDRAILIVGDLIGTSQAVRLDCIRLFLLHIKKLLKLIETRR
jgi:hypothetical protein